MTEKKFAKYELQTALLDGLFEPAKKVSDGHLRLRQIERWYDHRDNGKITKQAIFLRLRVPYLLGTSAESLLLAIVKISAQQGVEIEPAEGLDADGDAKSKSGAATITNIHKLMKEIGMSKGRENYRLIRQYLEQMSEIRVHYRNTVTGWSGSSWFLNYRLNEDTDELQIQLNWRLSGAIFGDYLHAEINLDERALLKRDPSKTLHRWLSAHIWPGREGYMLYETLAGHVWSEKATEGTQRKRVSRIKTEILTEIATLDGWDVTAGKDGATIKRRA